MITNSGVAQISIVNYWQKMKINSPTLRHGHCTANEGESMAGIVWAV